MTTTDRGNYADLLRLDGKAFIVIGVGEGIGRECAHALHDAGATLLCVDVNLAIADEAAAAVGGIAHRADVTRRADVEAMFERAVEHFGSSLTGVVDVVGLASNGPRRNYVVTSPSLILAP
jgi:3-oxoacyl-[acyl-carrier protein] reductase